MNLTTPAAGGDERGAALGEDVLALVAAAAAERAAPVPNVCAPRIGKMWRWKRNEPGTFAGAVPGAGACADEAVTPDCEVAKTRKA